MDAIVLVESEDVARDSMAGFFRSKGFTVLPFDDCRQALTFIEGNAQVGVALAEVCCAQTVGGELDTWSSRPDLPPLMAVTSSSPRDPFSIIERGFRTFFQKPLDLEAVLNTIRNMIRDRLVKPRYQSEYFGFLSDTAIQSGLRAHIESRLAGNGFDEKKINGVVLAVDEIYTNAVLHGNYGLASRKDDPEGWDERYKAIQAVIDDPGADGAQEILPIIHKKVYVDLKFAWKQALITIRDEGRGFDWKPHFRNGAKTARPAISGFGISIARRVMAKVLYNDEGNEVTLFARADLPQNTAR